MAPDAARARRARQHGGLPGRQPRARGIGRSRRRRSTRRWSAPTTSTGIADRRACSSTSATRSRRSRARDGSAGHAGRRDRADRRRPLGTGMEETDQITTALKYLPVGQARRARDRRALLRRSRPAPASATSGRRRWPAGRSASVRDGDIIEIVIDRATLTGRVELVGGRRAGARRRSSARRCSPRASRTRRCARTPAARRHAALGGAAARRAAARGRVRLRRRSHRRGARRCGGRPSRAVIPVTAGCDGSGTMTCGRARDVREMPEPPRSYWRLVGPGIVAGGVGLSSGEFVLWPFIASQVGLVLLWGALVGVVTQFFLNMEVERYTLATGETAVTGFNRIWRHWGLVFAVLAYFANLWPGWAISSATLASYLFGGNPTVIADPQPARHRRGADVRAGGLRGARAADLREGRRRADPGRSRRGLRHRAEGVAGVGRGVRPPGWASPGIERRAGVWRHRVCRLGRSAEPLSEQLDSGQGIRDGPGRATAGEPGDRRC